MRGENKKGTSVEELTRTRAIYCIGSVDHDLHRMYGPAGLKVQYRWLDFFSGYNSETNFDAFANGESHHVTV